MCGITGYIGFRDAYPIVINGLKRLEYRGYDSAGIMMYDGEKIHLSKTKGKVSELELITDKEEERKVLYFRYRNLVQPRLEAIYVDWSLRT